MGYAPRVPFPRDDLDLLARTEEVRIETSRPDGRRPRTIIWVMTDGEDVFVRSVRGAKGHWYQAALDDPLVVIHVGGRSIAARAIPAIDEASIRRCSEAIRRKYAGVPGEREMLVATALPTTLRLEPA